MAFDNRNEIDVIFNLFNSIHRNITFTNELEENNHFAFFHVNITKPKDNIETTVFKKQTHTRIYRKWDSYNHQSINQSRFYFFVRYRADNHIKTHTCGRKKRNQRQNDIR